MSRKKDDNYDVNSCAYCEHWQGRKNGCRLGEENCILLEEEQEIEENPCAGCAYANPVPCIGYCLKEIQQEMKDKNLGGKEVRPMGTLPGNQQLRREEVMKKWLYSA